MLKLDEAFALRHMWDAQTSTLLTLQVHDMISSLLSKKRIQIDNLLHMKYMGDEII